MHTGLIEGGVIPNISGVATFDIMSGSGLVVNNHTDPLNPIYANITWANSSSIAVENIATDHTSLIGRPGTDNGSRNTCCCCGPTITCGRSRPR